MINHSKESDSIAEKNQSDGRLRVRREVRGIKMRWGR